MNPTHADSQIDTAITTLIEALRSEYGYDFCDYAHASLRRRIVRAHTHLGFASVEHMQAALLRDKILFSQFLCELTVTTSEMFRDPDVYRILATRVIPVLASYPSIRVWHAGCSSGEEVYAMAILLKEAGLLSRTTIYATDINPRALQKARSGIYTTTEIHKATANYQRAGGLRSFADYYTAAYDSVVMDRSLKENIVFAEHNLATDAVFSEVHLVMCRNVMIYFNRAMQNRVLTTFYDSLLFKGFLCLGTKETLEFSDFVHVFTPIDREARVFQKLGEA